MLKAFLALVVLFSVLMIGLVFGRESSTQASVRESSSGSDSETSDNAPQAPAPSRTALRVSALKLFMDYHANEVAADNEFKGKQLEIKDMVSQIRKDPLDRIVLELSTPNEFEHISAYLASGQADEAARLQIGSVVTLHCVGAGIAIGSPMLRDCRMVEEAPEPPAAPMPEATPDGNGIYPIRNGVTPPTVLFAPEPAYSEEARAKKISGTVTVYLVVDGTGTPQNMHIVTPLGAGLDEKAIETVSRYRFKPAMYKGQPVPVEMNVEVRFQIF